jgi:glucokinase
MLLAGDIGGTKTALAVFTPERGPYAPVAEAVFPSAGYPGLDAIVREFLARTRLPVASAAFGVAGPVVGGRATVTNLPWTIDEAGLREELGLRSVRLINDLVAVARAVPHLRPEDLRTLWASEPAPGGAIAVIAPGTGLGEAFLTWDGTRYRPHPSEGGHADFAPASARQLGLLAHLGRDGEHVSYERVCSGRGLPHIYAFLKESGAAEEPAWLAARLAGAADPTPVIAAAALHEDPPCPLARAALDTFVAILGAEAGNLALKVLATGGVYLGGGIPRRILPALEQGRFVEAFRRKGRMSDLLARIPVHVILHPDAGLVGAACEGLGLP